MLKSDFMKKLVESFKKSLEEILSLIKEENYSKALESIDNTFSSLFRLNSMFFNSMTEENLMEILKAGGELEKDKAIIVSKLLKEKAHILELEGNSTESFYLYLKALNLYIEALLCDREAELTYFLDEIPMIIDKLSNYELPESSKKRLINYYKEVGDFASGEDILYELLEKNSDDLSNVNFGISYYNDLLKMDDETLEKGNLPREEVVDALNILKKKLN